MAVFIIAMVRVNCRIGMLDIILAPDTAFVDKQIRTEIVGSMKLKMKLKQGYDRDSDRDKRWKRE